MPKWRYRCPEGHANVQLSTTTFWCGSCYASTGDGTYSMTELEDKLERDRTIHA